MNQNVRPILHVPNVRATADWYREIGFTLAHLYDEGDSEGIFAVLAFGNGQVMFDSGGRNSSEQRREVDLYLDVDNVDEIHERVRDRVEVIEGVHDTFYGMREFIIRDLNGFWITFGQQVASSMPASV
jgi:uncharacterized glyoxalase superfamily protein PhnB